MKNVESTDLASQEASSPQAEKLQVSMEDVGQLDRVLRGYYLGQVKQIEGRRERRKARILMENHLVLPKSRQRTSKDSGYIQEVLGIDGSLLAQLEESRLIRRLNQSGHKPIYEVSHDTLVEPILAERNNREAIALFMRRYGRWFLLLLLLLFAFGMLFENWFDVVDDSLARRGFSSEEVHLQASGDIIAGQGTHPQTLVVPFSDIQAYRRNDSLTLYIGVNVTAHPDLDRSAGQDTISLNLGALPMKMSRAALERLLESGRDTAIPLRVMVPVGTGSNGLLADVAGVTLLRLQSEQLASADEPLPIGAAQRTRGMDMIETDLGRITLKASSRNRRVSLDTLVNLADMLKEDPVAQSLLQGKSLRLTYQVDVAATPPPGKQIEYVPVSGIEVQYSDGTSRFIPGDTNSAAQPTTHTVKTGETLYKISRLYGLTTAQLRQLNQLPDNNIKVGQVLRLK
ncbi:MAG: LysM peptidoglycan-binding domain-containing protein [Bacteroidia bacterium]|nr:LysM peptidoglycan-binding domain-containing protein [Bacteroidia bacterium]